MANTPMYRIPEPRRELHFPNIYNCEVGGTSVRSTVYYTHLFKNATLPLRPPPTHLSRPLQTHPEPAAGITFIEMFVLATYSSCCWCYSSFSFDIAYAVVMYVLLLYLV